MFWRIHGRLNQIDTLADALNKTETLRSLHEPFGSQGVAGSNPLDQRLGVDTRLNDTFFSFERFMGMRFRCRRLGLSLGNLPGIRRKQHRRTHAGVNGRDGRSPRSQVLHSFINLLTLFRMNEIQFVQDQQIGRGDLLFKGPFQITPFSHLFGIHHHCRETFTYPFRHRFAPEIQKRIKRQGHTGRFDDDPIGMNVFPDPLKRRHEFIGQFATDAPAFQFDVTLISLVSQQGLIDSQVTEFIRHDRDPHPLRLCLFKQVPHKRGFPGPEEP